VTSHRINFGDQRDRQLVRQLRRRYRRAQTRAAAANDNYVMRIHLEFYLPD
jgi:hypothetical protein